MQFSADELARLDEMTKPQAIYPNWFHSATLDEKLATALDYGKSESKAA